MALEKTKRHFYPLLQVNRRGCFMVNRRGRFMVNRRGWIVVNRRGFKKISL